MCCVWKWAQFFQLYRVSVCKLLVFLPLGNCYSVWRTHFKWRFDVVTCDREVAPYWETSCLVAVCVFRFFSGLRLGYALWSTSEIGRRSFFDTGFEKYREPLGMGRVWLLHVKLAALLFSFPHLLSDGVCVSLSPSASLHCSRLVLSFGHTHTLALSVVCITVTIIVRTYICTLVACVRCIFSRIFLICMIRYIFRY